MLGAQRELFFITTGSVTVATLAPHQQKAHKRSKQRDSFDEALLRRPIETRLSFRSRSNSRELDGGTLDEGAETPRRKSGSFMSGFPSPRIISRKNSRLGSMSSVNEDEEAKGGGRGRLPSLESVGEDSSTLGADSVKKKRPSTFQGHVRERYGPGDVMGEVVALLPEWVRFKLIVEARCDAPLCNAFGLTSADLSGLESSYPQVAHALKCEVGKTFTERFGHWVAVASKNFELEEVLEEMQIADPKPARKLSLEKPPPPRRQSVAVAVAPPAAAPASSEQPSITSLAAPTTASASQQLRRERSSVGEVAVPPQLRRERSSVGEGRSRLQSTESVASISVWEAKAAPNLQVAFTTHASPDPDSMQSKPAERHSQPLGKMPSPKPQRPGKGSSPGTSSNSGYGTKSRTPSSTTPGGRTSGGGFGRKDRGSRTSSAGSSEKSSAE